MEFHVSKENICVNETIFDGVLEQSVELDYMLPDYCPGIFKVLKSHIDTAIISQRMNGNKLTIDGVAVIKMLYVSENDNKLTQLEQKQAFTKSVELKEDCTGGYAIISSKCNYVNCRPVNSKRLDIHGAISMKTVVIKPKNIQIISDCNDLQLHKRETNICENKLFVTKDFTIKEELEIGHGKPAIHDILSYRAVATAQDYKMLANKIVCKGEISLHTLYLCSKTPDKPEVIEHTIPISQIIDLDGVDEDFKCYVRFEIVNYDIDMQIEDDGDCYSFTVELGVRAVCEAGKNKLVQLVDDCYSTCYETENIEEKIKLEKMNRLIQENIVLKKNISLNQSNLEYIYDMIYDIGAVNWTRKENSIEIMCSLSLTILAVDQEHTPICVEQTIPCEMNIDIGLLEQECGFEPYLQILNIAYTINSIDELELRIEFLIDGVLYEFSYENVMMDIQIHEEQLKTRDDKCALRLYFADAGESIWEIAKKYNTSVTAIIEQNSIDQEVLSSRGMILIPIVD